MYVAANSADIVKASYGSPILSQTQRNVIQAALSMGTLTVAAAGNHGVNQRWARFYPSAYLETLSVCGTENGSDRNLFNYGYTVDVYAAGRDVHVALPNGGYDQADGTSVATPLVSSIVALVKTQFPSFTPEQVRAKIRATADNIDAVHGSGLSGLLGRRRVNAQRAVGKNDSISVRLKDYTISDADGDGVLEEGERITVSATLRKYPGAIGSWSYEWKTNNNHLVFLSDGSGTGSSRAVGRMRRSPMTSDGVIPCPIKR